MISKLISGGQTGVDRAGLDAALELGIPIGGWCPKGRKAEDGPIDLKYPLRETAEEEYPVRTKFNILDSNATLVIVQDKNELDRGTLLTTKLCEQLRKVCLVVDLSSVEDMWRSYKFNIQILNVAGPRESKSPGIYEAAKKFLLEVLR